MAQALLLDGKVAIFIIFLCKSQNWKLQNAKTRVGFGRTEVSVRLDCIIVCALLFGYGLRNPGFQGFCARLDFHAFLARCFLETIMNNGNFNTKQLGSGLVVRSFPFC